MTKEEAWRIIEECRGWNAGQRSCSYTFNGERTVEDDMLDAKRTALTEAWKRVKEEK